MKKNTLFLGGAVCVMLILFLFFNRQNQPKPLQAENIEASTDLLNSALTKTHLNTDKVGKKAFSKQNQSCNSFWKKVVNVPINARLKTNSRIIEVVDSSSLKFFLMEPIKECQLDSRSALFSPHQSFLKHCQSGSTSFSDSKVSPECILAFLAYRLSLIAEQSSDLNISESADIPVLSAKLFAGAFSPVINLSKIQEIAKRILELEPNNGQALDYGLTATFADWEKSLNEGDTGASDQLEKSMGELFARAKEMRFSPLKIAELELNKARLQNNFQSMLEITESLEPGEVAEGLGLYYRAWALHLLGDDEEMIQQLNLIKETDPFFASAKLIIDSTETNQEPNFFQNVNRFIFAVYQGR